MTQNKRSAATDMKVFLIAFAILVSANVLTILLGFSYSVDMRGFWPIASAVEVTKSCVFASVLSVLNRKVCEFSLTFVFCLSGVLATVHIAHAMMYYIGLPDWVAINQGHGALTLGERVVFSDYTFYAPDMLFLLVAALWACRRIWRSETKISEDFD